LDHGEGFPGFRGNRGKLGSEAAVEKGIWEKGVFTKGVAAQRTIAKQKKSLPRSNGRGKKKYCSAGKEKGEKNTKDISLKLPFKEGAGKVRGRHGLGGVWGRIDKKGEFCVIRNVRKTTYQEDIFRGREKAAQKGKVAKQAARHVRPTQPG